MLEEKEVFHKDEIEINLQELIGNLLDHWIWIAVTTIIVAVLGLFMTKMLVTPQYAANVNMIVNARKESTGIVTNDNILSSKNLISTYAVILKSNIILEEVIEELQLEETCGSLAGRISVAPIDSTQVMRVTVTYPDPDVAYQILEKLTEISPPVIVDAIEAGSCKVISNVTVGKSPVTPSVKRNVILAAFAGMLLSSAFFVIRYLLANYIVDDQDVTKYLGLPTLAIIPEVEEE